jgi:hypothetical protein
VVLVFAFALAFAFAGLVSWMGREGGGGLLLGSKVSGNLGRRMTSYWVLHNHDACCLGWRLAHYLRYEPSRRRGRFHEGYTVDITGLERDFWDWGRGIG